MAPLAPYASAHASLNGPGDARPTALQIVEDQSLNNKLHGKVALITGCTSGIGVETARALYATGATVFITARDDKKGESVARSINGGDSSRPIEVINMELDSFESIKKAAAQFLSKSKTLNILIDNAGVMAPPEGRTVDGHETQFGTNHLGHFLFFQLLKPTLLSSSTPQFNSRVISLSSSGHKFSGVHFGNFNLDDPSDTYSPFKGYGQSKTANILFANELDRRYGKHGLHAISLHPGSIATELQRHMTTGLAIQQNDDYKRRRKNVEQGAATTIWAAIGKELEGRGGIFLEDVQESGPLMVDGKPFNLDDYGEEFAQDANKAAPYALQPGHAAHAFNEQAEKRLWVESCKLVGVSPDN